MNVFSEALTNKLVRRKIIQAEDYEVYQFGIECFLMKAYHIISYLIMGICFRMTWELLIFIVAFIPLRVYTGGYHAKTPLKCYLISCASVLSAIIVIKNAPLFLVKYSIVWALVVSLVLFIIVPVESNNKPLDDLEKAYYKKKAGIMIMVNLGVVIVSRMFSLENISFIISLSLTYLLGIALTGLVIKDS